MNSKVKKSVVFALVSWFFLHFITFYGANLFNGDAERIVVGSSIDDKIPLIPFFVLIYAMAYVQWFANLFVLGREKEEMVFKYFASDTVGKLIAAALFILIPTTMIQPVVEPTDFWRFHLCLLYSLDDPVNLFPSLHCFESYICMRVALEGKKTSKFYKVFSVILTVLVVAATVFTKQHVLIDLPAGIILAELCLQVIGRGWLPEAIQKLYSKLDKHPKENKENKESAIS